MQQEESACASMEARTQEVQKPLCQPNWGSCSSESQVAQVDGSRNRCRIALSKRGVCAALCCIALSDVPGVEKVAPSGVVPDSPDANLQQPEEALTRLIWRSDTPGMPGVMTQLDSTSELVT